MALTARLRLPLTRKSPVQYSHGRLQRYERRTRMDQQSQPPYPTTTSEEPFVIIAGHYRVDRQHRDNLIATFEDLVTRARGAEGAIHISITAASVDPERVNVLEVGRDSAALERWRERANGPELELVMPDMRIKRYEAYEGGPLFD